MTEIADGVHPDIPDHVYHASRRLSSTGARLLLPPSLPSKFKHRMDNPEPPKRAYDVGHVTHRLVLGKGAEFEVLSPEIHGLKKDGTIAVNPRSTSTWIDAEAEARQLGLVPIHGDDYVAADDMARAIHGHPECGAILYDGAAEISLFATDPETGVELRARPDWSRIGSGRTLLADVKTTAARSQDEFERSAAKYGYHIQEAFYRRAAKLLGLGDARFVFLVVEKSEPHEAYVAEWDTEAAAEGARLVRQAIDTYARCRDANTWPGYPSGIRPMSLPMWAFEDEMEFSE